MDVLHTLQLAVDQLQRLRRENEILRARVESFHLAGQFLMAKPVENYQGSEVDALHYLQKLVHEEQSKREAKATASAPHAEEWPEHAVERD